MKINIYSDPQLYDAAHVWKTNDIEFITNCAIECGGPILEMASGTGRLAEPLVKRGLDYTGVELSAHLWSIRKKVGKIQGKHVVVQGDMKILI